MLSSLLRSSAILFILFQTSVFAQSLPFTKLYDDSQVYSIYLTLPADSLEEIYDNLENDIYYHCTFVYDDGITQDTVNDVGFRLRGNTSLSSAKKSFKISFNTFVAGRKYEGVEKLNLLGMHNDPTMVREHLYFDTYSEMGLPEHRSNFVRVYINGDYFGLYTNMEHIDEVFVNDRFKNNIGNLFKCTWPADLQWRGDNPDEYIGNGYEQHINEEEGNVDDLIHFLDVLNNTPDEDFVCAIEEVFNVSLFLKTYALDIASGHWDSYAGNINNFYLYQNILTGQFEFLSFDCDNTFGVDWLGFDWTDQPIYDWPTGWYDVPLVQRLLEVDVYREQLGYYLDQIHNTVLQPDYVSDKVLAWRELVADAAMEDLYRTYDWGYSFADFWNGFTANEIDGHTPYGIIPFSEERAVNTSLQLEPYSISPIITDMQLNPFRPVPGNNFSVRCFVEDDGSLASVQCRYEVDGEVSYISMFDDGSHDDGLAGDGKFGNSIYLASSAEYLTFGIVAVDDDEQESMYPSCDWRSIHVGATPPGIVINEVMALNASTIADEAGDFEDYIELYNNSSNTVSLYGYFLSDDPLEPWKWQLPNSVMGPDSYLIIWADNEASEGAYHANFRLDVDGETIGLYGPAMEMYLPVDTLAYPSLSEDLSWGRLPNGSGDFTELPQPSPGANNELEEDPVVDELPRPYLTNNPTRDYSELRFDALGATYYEVWMSDVSGRNLGLLYSQTPQEGPVNIGIQTTLLAEGIYFLRLVTADSARTFPLVKI